MVGCNILKIKFLRFISHRTHKLPFLPDNTDVAVVCDEWAITHTSHTITHNDHLANDHRATRKNALFDQGENKNNPTSLPSTREAKDEHCHATPTSNPRQC